MRTRIPLAIPVVAWAFTLAGCGDGAPSKASFIAQADAACTPGNTTVSTTAKPTNAPQVATAAGTAVTTIDSQVGALRALKLPGGADKVRAQSIVTDLANVSAPTKALQDAAGRNDDAAMAKAALDMQAKADAAAGSAQAFGLAQCGIQMKYALGNMFDGVKNVVKASYVTKADNLCRDSFRKSDAIAAPGSTPASLARYFDAVVGLTTKLVADIKALPTPPGDEAAVGEFLVAMDSMNAKITEAAAAIKSGNLRLASGLFDEIDVAETAVNAKLDAYGMKACGSNG